jgi:hypothetical protein
MVLSYHHMPPIPACWLLLPVSSIERAGADIGEV